MKPKSKSSLTVPAETTPIQAKALLSEANHFGEDSLRERTLATTHVLHGILERDEPQHSYRNWGINE